MRDGIVLRAELVRPSSGADTPSPCLVYRTPYGKDDALRDYRIFTRAVERGYAVLVQDVRGRGASDGEFVPYQNEGKDGYDTIEWVARQPWCNGRVGTFGLSYPGAVQWLAAVENPPHLEAMVPAMTFASADGFFYSGGVWDMSWLYWIWHNVAPDVRARRSLTGPKTAAEADDAWKKRGAAMERTLPLAGLQDLRQVAPYYYEWLSHPPDDPWWNWADLRGQYGQVRAAVLNLSGWYDDSYGVDGAITNFTGLVRSRGGADIRASLLIGPWSHGVEETALTRAGEREFGPTAAIAYDDVVLGWMDRHLRAGRPNNRGDERRVRYFAMGRNEWREADTWPPAAAAVPYYLTVRDDGARYLDTAAPSKDAPPARFVSNPLDPVTNRYDAAGAHDYRALADRSDVLTFDSAPLKQDVEVTGPITAEVFIRCDCRDTDLWVRILDVAPDGTAFNLASPGLDVVRASYREPGPRRLLTPGTVHQIRLDRFVTSNVFKRGHRIRVQISATFFPNYSRNLHTGALETSSAEAKQATIEVFHDRERPSRIVLPEVRTR